MKIDVSELLNKLNNLTGKDYEAAEREARMSGNNVLDLNYSKNFHARLAAKALGVSHEEITNLPLQEYVTAVVTVNNFLSRSDVSSIAGMLEALQDGEKQIKKQAKQ